MMSAGRIEPRMTVNIIACLETPDVVATPETVTTENISEHGARVISSRRWAITDRVVVSDLFGDFHLSAEVIYCEPLKDGQFAVGVKFATGALELAQGIPLSEKA